MSLRLSDFWDCAQRRLFVGKWVNYCFWIPRFACVLQSALFKFASIFKFAKEELRLSVGRDGKDAVESSSCRLFGPFKCS